MKHIAENIAQLIGHTPLLRLNAYCREQAVPANIVVKLECFNPGGSVKDRVALSMINRAETEGMLLPGGTIIEPTSGNTGIGLAMVAASRGYRLILTMPETMSVERRKLLAQLGATIILTPAAKGIAGAIEEAERLHEITPDSIIAGQFNNPANPEAHLLTTGPEIWHDTDGKIDIFVAGVGTGGTVSGVGKYLKSKKPDIEIIAVEPAESAVLEGKQPGPHGIQGIGAGFTPENFNRSVVDRIMAVTTSDAIATSRKLAYTEGVLAGISSGAALHAATLLAADASNRGKTIVALLPDTGERYISTSLFDS